jgi:hypothetical protein
MERFRGRTITFKFTEGAMANKAYAHTFNDEGDVTYKAAGSDGEGTRAQASTIEQLREDVWIVSYRGEGGYTLTSVLDFASNTLVAIASNDKDLSVHRGTFETARDVMDVSDQDQGVAQSPTPIH